jgi:hypothetical protein
MRRILDGMTLEILVERQREIERKSAGGANRDAALAPGGASGVEANGARADAPT